MCFGDVIDFAALTALYFFVFFKKWRARGNYALFINTLLYIYLSFVFFFTLMPVLTSLPFIFDHSYVPMNLEPFIDLTAGHGGSAREIALNIIMTIPFGFLLPLVRTNLPLLKDRHPTFLKILLYTFLLSLAIELIQPLISDLRTSDITDLITNVLGGAIGYLFYLLFKPLTTKCLSALDKT